MIDQTTVIVIVIVIVFGIAYLNLFSQMAIKIKAVERNVSFQEGVEKYAFVLQTDLYNKLSDAKVIQEAALRSGINKGAINAAWDAIGEVIKAWATEGHSVAVPGLGTMRFGIRSTSVENVNDVATKLITSRRVIFTPNSDIKNELKSTSINITCYDRKGNIIKRVNSTDDSEVEDPDNDNPTDPNGGGNGGGTQGGGTDSGNTNRQYTISVTSANTAQGTVTGGGTYSEGSRVNISATPKAGYQFDKWNDGNTSATRTVNVCKNESFVAQFKVADSTENPGGSGDDDNPDYI